MGETDRLSSGGRGVDLLRFAFNWHLKIGDYLVEVSTSRDDLSYQEALIIAMKEEKAAFKLYSDLAARTDDAGAREVLLMLAQEEAKHKLRFEIEYDDFILREH